MTLIQVEEINRFASMLCIGNSMRVRRSAIDAVETRRIHPILFAVERKMIADCPYNSMWIDRLIGTTERLEINQKRITCSGTTLGTLSSICGYVDRFTQKADRYLRAVNGIGIDQGIHNLLIHLRGVFSAINNDEHIPCIAAGAGSPRQ